MQDVREIPLASDPAPEPEPSRRRRLAVRGVVLTIVLAFAAFWTWALFFASKEAVNKIEDRAWAERAEEICADANAARERELADYRPIGRDPDPALIRERAAIVDAATDMVESMLDDVMATPPADDKGRAIVPMWEDDYRAYIADRRAYTDRLRASGENLAFFETAVDGIPITEKLETFAGDNEMPSCAPPRDLSR